MMKLGYILRGTLNVSGDKTTSLQISNISPNHQKKIEAKQQRKKGLFHSQTARIYLLSESPLYNRDMCPSDTPSIRHTSFAEGDQ